ncbi:unnamed protein product [Brassica napus]|uniref:(rape) hypothetical protein n=1 Tax=Brassica napus TaxID=3708 RepID=A0A816IUK0_BRANA|nr:unnamed protein product [Brassica napus]
MHTYIAGLVWAAIPETATRADLTCLKANPLRSILTLNNQETQSGFHPAQARGPASASAAIFFIKVCSFHRRGYLRLRLRLRPNAASSHLQQISVFCVQPLVSSFSQALRSFLRDLRNEAKELNCNSEEPFQLYDQVLRCNPGAFEYAIPVAASAKRTTLNQFPASASSVCVNVLRLRNEQQAASESASASEKRTTPKRTDADSDSESCGNQTNNTIVNTFIRSDDRCGGGWVNSSSFFEQRLGELLKL